MSITARTTLLLCITCFCQNDLWIASRYGGKEWGQWQRRHHSPCRTLKRVVGIDWLGCFFISFTVYLIWHPLRHQWQQGNHRSFIHSYRDSNTREMIWQGVVQRDFELYIHLCSNPEMETTTYANSHRRKAFTSGLDQASTHRFLQMPLRFSCLLSPLNSLATLYIYLSPLLRMLEPHTFPAIYHVKPLCHRTLQGERRGFAFRSRILNQAIRIPMCIIIGTQKRSCRRKG